MEGREGESLCYFSSHVHGGLGRFVSSGLGVLLIFNKPLSRSYATFLQNYAHSLLVVFIES